MSVESTVLEYSILYTTRITQKLKNWNDGTLQYYKLNNKIIIKSQENVVVSTGFLLNKEKPMLDEDEWGKEFQTCGLLIMINELITSTFRELEFNSKSKQYKILNQIDHNVPRATKLNAPLQPKRMRRVGLSRRRVPAAGSRHSAQQTSEPISKSIKKLVNSDQLLPSQQREKKLRCTRPSSPSSLKSTRTNSSCDGKPNCTAKIYPSNLNESDHIGWED